MTNEQYEANENFLKQLRQEHESLALQVGIMKLRKEMHEMKEELEKEKEAKNPYTLSVTTGNQISGFKVSNKPFMVSSDKHIFEVKNNKVIGFKMSELDKKVVKDFKALLGEV